MTTNSLDKWFNHAATSARQYGARHGIHLDRAKTLEKWVYVLAILLAALWTLAMWSVYALLGMSDEALSAGSRFFTIDAQVLEWLTSFVGGTQQLGEAFVLITWGLGVVLLVLATWLGRRLVRVFGNPSNSGASDAI